MPLRPLARQRQGGGVTSVSRSHVGLVRVINEDRVLDCAANRLWAVADGMGGHRGGDLAAQTAIDALRELTQGRMSVSLALIAGALHGANAAILARNRELRTDAGTTIVAATVNDATAHIAWVGDSRAYRLRDGEAELLTTDHSVVQELIDAGLLTADMAERHPRANVVTRALGVMDTLEIATVRVELTSGDTLLLCSDGLSRSLAEGITHEDDPELLADTMLRAALARDGSDNTSLVLIRLP